MLERYVFPLVGWFFDLFYKELEESDEVKELRMVAAALELAIVSGTYGVSVGPDYDGRYTSSEYMCTALNQLFTQGRISTVAYNTTHNYISRKLGYVTTLNKYLMECSDDTAYYAALTDPDEKRIYRCNWYWKFIRELRNGATMLHLDNLMARLEKQLDL